VRRLFNMTFYRRSSVTKAITVGCKLISRGVGAAGIELRDGCPFRPDINPLSPYQALWKQFLAGHNFPFFF
jgi:hypothetical protein